MFVDVRWCLSFIVVDRWFCLYCHVFLSMFVDVCRLSSLIVDFVYIVMFFCYSFILWFCLYSALLCVSYDSVLLVHFFIWLLANRYFIIILFTWLCYSCLNQGNWVCETVSKARQHLYKGSKWLLARVEIYALHLRNSQGRRERQPRLFTRFT